MSTFFKSLIFSNVFVAFCAASLCLSSQLLFGQYNFHITAFIFFATLFTYNFQRLARTNKHISHPRISWISQNRSILFLTAFVSALISSYYFTFFNVNTQGAIIFCALISLLYPFILRRIPYLKIFFISLIWMISTCLLTALEQELIFDRQVFLHSLARFFFVFAITIPFDIRDIKFDNKRLKTIPSLLGIKKSHMIGILSLVIVQISYLYLFISYNLNVIYLVAISISIIITGFLVIKSNEKKGEMYFSFGVESTSIIFYIILVISSQMV